MKLFIKKNLSKQGKPYVALCYGPDDNTNVYRFLTMRPEDICRIACVTFDYLDNLIVGDCILVGKVVLDKVK